MIVYRYGALKPVHGFDAMRDQLWRACRYRNVLVELLNWRIIAQQRGSAERATRLAAGEITVEQAKVLAVLDGLSIRARHADMSRWLRSRSGVGWGTYQAIEADIKRAAKAKYVAPRKGSGRARWFAQARDLGLDPTRFRARFRAFDGAGRIAANVQACSGLSTDQVLIGNTGSLRLSGAQGKIVARLDVGLGHVISLPVIAHRALPAAVHVVRAVLCVDRIGTRYVYSLHITMRHSAPERQFGEGVAAINFGWRSLGTQGVRVAYVVGEHGEEQQLVLPRKLIDKFKHAESLRSLADDAAVAYLGDAKRRSRARREALRDPAATNRELSTIPIVGEPLSAEHWARRDRHLYQWERDEYARCLPQRQEIYRLWVRSLAARYATIRLEDFDLPTLIARDKPAKIPEARHVRFLVAPGWLRDEIKSVFGAPRVEIVAVKKRTMVCSQCGGELTGDRARKVELWCEQCGAARDQDATNAQNQLLDPAAE